MRLEKAQQFHLNCISFVYSCAEKTYSFSRHCISVRIHVLSNQESFLNQNQIQAHCRLFVHNQMGIHLMLLLARCIGMEMQYIYQIYYVSRQCKEKSIYYISFYVNYTTFYYLGFFVLPNHSLQCQISILYLYLADNRMVEWMNDKDPSYSVHHSCTSKIFSCEFGLISNFLQRS